MFGHNLFNLQRASYVSDRVGWGIMGQNFIFVIITWNVYKLGYFKVAEKRISDVFFLQH